MSEKTTSGLATALAALLTFGSPAQAHDHLVSREDVSAHLARATAERRAAMTLLDGVVTSPAGREATALLGLGVERVRARLTHLTDAEARDLAARARALDVDPTAGGLNGSQITLIVVGGVLVLLLIALAFDWLVVNHCDDFCAT